MYIGGQECGKHGGGERVERHAKIDAQTLKALTNKTDRRQISLTSEKTVYAGR